MYHWVPYDERQLFSMLAMDRAAVERWLEDDDVHTLAQLVRRRGLDPGDAAQELVSAWAGDAPAQQQASLVDRALRTLTEGHLAQHRLLPLRPLSRPLRCGRGPSSGLRR